MISNKYTLQKFFSGWLIIFSLSSVSSPGNSVAQSTQYYEINPERSTFIVYAARGGLFKFFGHNHTIAVRNFSGRVSLDPQNIEPASLTLTLPADSLVVLDDVKEDERIKIQRDMREKVLETGSYPEIRFASTTVESEKKGEHHKLRIKGDLTLHGVTKEIEIEVEMTRENNWLRGVGRFAIKQKDFGIKPVSAAGGTVNVKDELKLSFDIFASQISGVRN